MNYIGDKSGEDFLRGYEEPEEHRNSSEVSGTSCEKESRSL
jgi:hypothetical protein